MASLSTPWARAAWSVSCTRGQSSGLHSLPESALLLAWRFNDLLIAGLRAVGNFLNIKSRPVSILASFAESFVVAKEVPAGSRAKDFVMALAQLFGSFSPAERLLADNPLAMARLQCELRGPARLHPCRWTVFTLQLTRVRMH